jgi:hypothetical protein
MHALSGAIVAHIYGPCSSKPALHDPPPTSPHRTMHDRQDRRIHHAIRIDGKSIYLLRWSAPSRIDAGQFQQCMSMYFVELEHLPTKSGTSRRP